MDALTVYVLENATSDIREKIKANYPCFDFIVDPKGRVVDIKLTPDELNKEKPNIVEQGNISEKSEIELLQQANVDLMLAIAEMAEATELAKTETQVAIAELAEIIAGGA